MIPPSLRGADEGAVCDQARRKNPRPPLVPSSQESRITQTPAVVCLRRRCMVGAGTDPHNAGRPRLFGNEPRSRNTEDAFWRFSGSKAIVVNWVIRLDGTQLEK